MEAMQALGLPEITPDDRRCVVNLKKQIEELVDHPLAYSLSATTPRGTPHVVIANGFVKPERDEIRSLETVQQACDQSLETCRQMRAKIAGDAVLWWRREPMLERGMSGAEFDEVTMAFTGGTPALKLTMRLCFEAL